MKKNIWNKQIPTLFALIILTAGIGVTSLLIQKSVNLIGKASPDTLPQNILITNITDTSFTVTFGTREKTTAAITLDAGGLLIFDDRDKSDGVQKAYYSHHITVPNLKSSQIYTFAIISNGTLTLDGDKKFTVKTAPSISETPPPDQKPIYGKILTPEGAEGKDVLLVVKVPGAQILSGITKNTGEFIIPTNSLRTANLEKYALFKQDTPITLEATQQNLRSQVTALYQNALSLPPLTLSSQYNFTDVISEKEGSGEGALSIPQIKKGVQEITIIIPQDNTFLIDAKPMFSGTAMPNQKVKIIIESNPTTTEVFADGNGTWSFRPSNPLAPGNHTITIETKDKYGIVKRLKHAFSVFASGSQVAQTATPSATPLPTPTRRPTPTATQTPTPTSIALPTSIITPSPTAAVSPTIFVAPTSQPTLIPAAPTTSLPTPKLPSPGSTSTTVLTFVSVIFILTGASLLFIL